MRALPAALASTQRTENAPYKIATTAQASAIHKPYCCSIDPLPLDWTNEAARNGRLARV
ncbi:hypothetical protein MBSD_n0465 [Mizugakiibacter sediminis]|uniref:Uncharacterized protein n=1 Tax=Mizugakiibacter sediminis TaxID=1475481 RepID=A0A0K8QKJ0_9GAMM|nr:hypothetical protein MBSD_n0465 [Mizugakiibacter sediminis]